MAKPGDAVKVHTKDETFEGTLMPRPELLGDGICVLKLSSGYNIGIDRTRVVRMETVAEYKHAVPRHEPVAKDPALATVVVISTGGTISSKVDYKTGGVVASYDAHDLIAMCPELKGIANIKHVSLLGKMSEDMDADDWIRIAEETAKHAGDKDVAGIVITHGTDTMHYTTAALSYMLFGLSKPVIVTGAQRSVDRGSSDAFMNLICSMRAAAAFDGAGVFLCMHATTSDDYCYLHHGTKVRKMHTLRRDAFRSINAWPAAKVYTDRIEAVPYADYAKRGEGTCKPDAVFEKKTGLVLVHPNMDADIIRYYHSRGYKGLVLAATALGHVPKQLLPVIADAAREGMIIAITTQALYGRVDPLVYSRLRELSIASKTIFCEDLLPETALVKLGWVLAHTTDYEKVKAMMQKPMAHDINLRHDPTCFLQ